MQKFFLSLLPYILLPVVFLGVLPLEAATLPLEAATAQSSGTDEAETSEAAMSSRTIRMVELDWDSARVAQEVLARLLRNHFGFEIEWVPGNGMTLKDISESNAADLVAEVWFPEQSNSWPRYIGPNSDRSLHTNRKSYSARDGIFVSQRVARDHALKKIEDLRRPEIVRLFDSDGDGRGEMWIGEDGWNSTFVQQVKAKGYGYAALYDLQIGPEKAQWARVREAFQAGRPVVFYGWDPSEALNSFNLVRLEEPPFTGFRGEEWKEDPQYDPDGCFYLASTDDPNWFEKSEINCATPISKIWIVYRADFAHKHPEVARFLHQTVITEYMVRSWLRLLVDYQMEAKELARLWIENNPEIVAEWLEGSESAMIP